MFNSDEITHRNPYESENDKDTMRYGANGREIASKFNKGAAVFVLTSLAAALTPDIKNYPDVMHAANIAAGIWISALHYYLKSESTLVNEGVMQRGLIEDILHNRGKDITGRHPGNKSIAAFFSQSLLNATGQKQDKRKFANAALVQQVSGDLFTLMKRATETVNKDNLTNIYQQYRQIDVNTLHLAVMLGADHSEPARKLKAHEALSDPVVQRLFAEGKRLLPTLADNTTSTFAFLRHLRGALGNDAYYILKEPTNTLKAIKEYNTLCMSIISAGAKHSDQAFCYQVLNQHTKTLINDSVKGTLSLHTLMTCLNDIQSLKEVVTPRVLYEEQQQKNTDQPLSPLRPLMDGCDRLLDKYRPLFKQTVDALPEDLRLKLFEMKQPVDLTGFTIDMPKAYQPKSWPTEPEAQSKKIETWLYKNQVNPLAMDPHYAFMLGVEQVLEKAILSNEHFYAELGQQPRLPACKAIVERVLQRTFLTQMAYSEKPDLPNQTTPSLDKPQQNNVTPSPTLEKLARIR